jgi:hypothetical protein
VNVAVPEHECVAQSQWLFRQHGAEGNLEMFKGTYTDHHVIIDRIITDDDYNSIKAK